MSITTGVFIFCAFVALAMGIGAHVRVGESRASLPGGRRVLLHAREAAELGPDVPGLLREEALDLEKHGERVNKTLLDTIQRQ